MRRISPMSSPAARYIEYTGESNERATSNLSLLEERVDVSRILVRVPRIFGHNTHEDIMRSARQLRARGFETEVFDYLLPDSLNKQYSDEDELTGDVIDSDAVETEGSRAGNYHSHKALKIIYQVLTTPLMGDISFNHTSPTEEEYTSWDQ